MYASEQFEMVAGDSEKLVFTVEMSGADTLAGATVRWWMASKRKAPTDQVEVKKTGSITGPKTFEVNLEPSDTADLKAGTYYHEAEVVLSSGAVKTCTVGTATIHHSMIPPA